MLMFSRIESQDIGEVEAFYSLCGYGGGVNKQDLVFTVRVDGVLVGAVRLCRENDYLALRGMQILPAFQRQGVGTQLLQECIGQIEQVCYCLPYKHLEPFYRQVGFELILSSDVPCELVERLDAYLKRGLNVVLMRRQVQPAT